MVVVVERAGANFDNCPDKDSNYKEVVFKMKMSSHTFMLLVFSNTYILYHVRINNVKFLKSKLTQISNHFEAINFA